MQTVAVIAIRGSIGAKTRLASRFSEHVRADLAWTMFLHVLGVIRESGIADHLLIVTREPEETRHHTGASPNMTILPQPVEYSGLNAAFDLGRDWAIAHGFETMLILHPDLPLLGTADLQRIAQADATVVLAPDQKGVGTNALRLRLDHPRGHLFTFRFGPDSHRLHLQEAASLALAEVHTPGLARDLDWPEDWDNLPETARDRLLGHCRIPAS